jgi:hypothetical protein
MVNTAHLESSASASDFSLKQLTPSTLSLAEAVFQPYLPRLEASKAQALGSKRCMSY